MVPEREQEPVLEGNFQCLLCGMRFDDQQELDEHNRKQHKDTGGSATGSSGGGQKTGGT